MIADDHWLLLDGGYGLLMKGKFRDKFCVIMYNNTSPGLVPYRGVRYHVREWQREGTGRPMNYQELFNYRYENDSVFMA